MVDFDVTSYIEVLKGHGGHMWSKVKRYVHVDDVYRYADKRYFFLMEVGGIECFKEKTQSRIII